MDRIPLPPSIIARQQRITVEDNGEITRDRMMIIQQKELVPMTDPIVRDFIINEMAERNVAKYRAQAVPSMVGWFFLSYVVAFPAFLWFFWTITHMEWAYKH